MSTNFELLIQICKAIINQHPELAQFLSQILFEVERKEPFINHIGSIEAIEYCCLESDFIIGLNLDDDMKDYLRVMMMAELMKM
jgi:hypothetical protein